MAGRAARAIRVRVHLLILLIIGGVLSGPASIVPVEVMHATGPVRTVTPLGSVAGVLIPEGAAVLALARITLDPGAELATHEVPGWEIIVLESGALTVNIRGEIEDEDHAAGVEELLVPATPGSSQIGTPSLDVFAFDLRPGDRLLVPPDTPHWVANDGDGAATYLAAAITPVAPRPGQSPWPPAGIGPPAPLAGIEIVPMSVGYNVPASLVPGPSDVHLERITLETGAAVEPAGESAAHLWYIEEGVLRATGPATGVVASQPSTTWRAEGAGAAPGSAITLGAGDAVLIDRDVDWTATATGSLPVTAIVLSVQVSEGPATPAAH